MMEVVKKEILKLLDAGIIYPISDSKWVSPVQVVPKKTGITIVENSYGELVPTRVQNGWRVCIDFRKLNSLTRNDQFPISFIHQMLERLAENLTFVVLMAIQVFIRYQLPLRIRRRLPLHVLSEPLHTDVCHWVFVTLPPLFRGAWSVFFQTM